MRTTIAQKLAKRQAHAPGIIYSLLVKLVMPILSKKLSPTFTYKAFPGKDEGPFVLISNHASRIDYLYTAPVCWPRKLNFVVGYNEFFLCLDLLTRTLGHVLSLHPLTSKAL